MTRIRCRLKWRNETMADKLSNTLSDHIANMTLATLVSAFNNTSETTIATYGGRRFDNVKGYIIIAIVNSSGDRIFATTIVPTEVFFTGNANIARFINIDNNNTLVPVTLRVTWADHTHVYASISSSDFYGKVYAFNYQNS